MSEDAVEEWRAVPGYEGLYEVSSLGRVRSLDRYVPWGTKRAFWRGRLLKPTVSGTGYLYIGLAGRTDTVHRLVAAAFLGPCPPGKQVAHADGDRTNPRLSNLRYATQRENEADKLLHGKHQLGERGPNAKLTADQVREIRALRGTATQREIAARFGTSQPNVVAIFKERSWKCT